MKLVVDVRQRQQETKRGQASPGNTAINRTALRQINYAVLNNDSVWRRLGVTGAFSCVRDGQGRWKPRCVLGFQPPWSWMQSVLFQLDLASHLDGSGGFSITSGHVYLRNRVSIDHPFMRACCSGDLALMKQCLGDEPWAIRNRCIRTGETPLLVRSTYTFILPN